MKELSFTHEVHRRNDEDVIVVKSKLNLQRGFQVTDSFAKGSKVDLIKMAEKRHEALIYDDLYYDILAAVDKAKDALKAHENPRTKAIFDTIYEAFPKHPTED